MDIAQKKREILQLVEQLHSQSVPRKRGRAVDITHRGKTRLPQDLLAVPRAAELEKISGRTSSDSLEDRLLNICKGLEERIQKLERVVSQNLEGGKSQNHPRAQSGTDVAEINIKVEKESKKPQRKEEQDYSLGGKIQEGILPDLLQLVSSNNKTGIFSLEHMNRRIELFFDDGNLYHAKADDMEGQNAFFAAMALEEGRFYFRESEELPPEKTIDGNTQFMILEALRQIDEQRNDE